MEILKGIKIVDLALKYQDYMILGDLHLGFEGSLAKKGINFPINQVAQVKKRIEKIIKKAKPKTIIINGDLKDDFSTITRNEWKDSAEFISFLREYANLVFIKGNHDTILAPLAKKFEVPLKEKFDIDDTSIVHGDKLFKSLKKTIIIGHEHPAVSFKEKPSEKFKCFLLGRYKSHNLIIMPSFNLLIEGSDITKEEFLSPYIKNINDFKVFVVQDKVYGFGKVRNLD